MIDLTPVLRDIVRSDVSRTWTHAAFKERLGELAGPAAAEVDWDEEAGELWARLVVGSEGVAAALSARGPLLVVSERSMDRPFADASLIVVRVPDMNAAFLRCDKAVLQSFFAQELFTEQFDYSCFSFDDLYYETAT